MLNICTPSQLTELVGLTLSTDAAARLDGTLAAWPALPLTAELAAATLPPTIQYTLQLTHRIRHYYYYFQIL